MSDAPTDTTTGTDESVETPQLAEQAAPAESSPPEKPGDEKPADEKPADEKPADEKPAKPAKKAAAKKTTAKKTAAKKTTAKKATAKKTTAKAAAAPQSEQLELAPQEAAAEPAAEADEAAAPTGTAVLFQAPQKTTAPRKARAPRTAAKKVAPPEEPEATDEDAEETTDEAAAEASAETATTPEPADGETPAEGAADAADESKAEDQDADDSEDDEDDEDGSPSGQARRRRRRGGRRRRKPAGSGGGSGDSTQGADGEAEADRDEDKAPEGDESAEATDAESREDAESGDDGKGEGGSTSSRRRRRRRRSGEGGDGDNGDDSETTVTRVRKPRSAEDEITSIQGSTRLEAKKQRRREGREAGRRRAPIVSEAEFLARRESVERVMAIRQRKDLTQIAVLEDKVLVEHYVAREAQTSLIGNVYLGRVQNVLPSMEAAFIDIGKGRNAVLYAGEVNWSSLGHKEGEPRKIESVLQSGQTILVQVTKDPVGHKGARLTSQVSLAGRFLVYVPDGTTSGISRKLPDTERARLKSLLKEIVPESAGVIVRTAAEGASEEELTRDVERLKARWEDIESKVAKGNAPQLLYGEPDLTLKVVRDLFTEDFAKLVVQGDDAWASVEAYVEQVAPDLTDRLERFESNGQGNGDLFSTYRIDEQIAKGLDRKVWLPSGGSLIIDRTEAMTVIDVNTGKFTGSGGNLEETVTKNNLEAAEEIVRQLRLRDIGGIIVVDFIDMVLESNRDLVLRRLVECLGRDRTRHQVAEVTSLGLVQMTRKRIGTGLLEAFSENCSHCQGRGIIVHDLPVEPKRGGGGGNGGDTADGGGRGGRRRRGKGQGEGNDSGTPKAVPSPKDIAAMAKHAPEDEDVQDIEVVEDAESADTSSVEVSSAEERATPEPAVDEPVVDEPVLAEAPAPREVSSDRPVEAPVEETPADVVPAQETPAAEETPAVEETPAEPVAKTTVVTRTRRRAASRPAGPPATASEESAGESAAESAAEPAAEAPEPGPHVEHVPVKKKGARKR